MLRAVVSEEEYGLVARFPAEEGEFRSDRIAAALRVSMSLTARGRESSVVPESDGAVSVRVPLGDAPERVYEEAAGDLLEAASW
jgi:hypothetical protein